AAQLHVEVVEKASSEATVLPQPSLPRRRRHFATWCDGWSSTVSLGNLAIKRLSCGLRASRCCEPGGGHSGGDAGGGTGSGTARALLRRRLRARDRASHEDRDADSL